MSGRPDGHSLNGSQALRARIRLSCGESSTDYAEGKSAFADHLFESGHEFHPDHNVTLLHIYPKSRTLDKLEQIEICKAVHSDTYEVVNDLEFLGVPTVTAVHFDAR